MLRIHANVYTAPSALIAGDPVRLRGLQLATLKGEQGGPPAFDRPIVVDFETIQARLGELDLADCEPDGFFLVSGHAGPTFWRLNGHMHEHEGRMHRVELHGECPEPALDAVLRVMGWPESPLVFELVQEGVTLDEPDFHRWASAV
jgi:hypothetical protein